MSDNDVYFQGQFLIAMPGMGDPRFERSVVFVCTHSESGAMGLVINKPLNDITFADVVEEVIHEPHEEAAYQTASLQQQVWFGGPVEKARGLVLHTADYQLETSLPIGSDILLTASVDILKDIVQSKGPKKTLFALGYAGWGGGQLDSEIASNSWLTCKVSHDILFDRDGDAKYNRALALLGIDPALLSAQAGHA